MSKTRLNIPTQLQNISDLTTAINGGPAGAGDTGVIVYNSVLNTLHVYNGTYWDSIIGRQSSVFRFNSNLFTSSNQSFRGVINNLNSYHTAGITAVSYQTRLDTVSTWTDIADLTALQTWVNANVTGTQLTGLIFWINCLATFDPTYSNEAENTLMYTV